MHNLKLLEELYKLLRMESRYCSEDGVLLKNSIVESALAMRPDLIKLLLSHEGIKSNFFTDVEGVMVFDKIRFQKFVMNKRFLPDSYTSFKNKIGLTGDDGDFLADSREVVLSWPYKDCVLEGGQTKEDAKRNEVFWNEILAPDEINRLTEPKALTSFARYDSDGKHKVSEITADDNLIIKGNNLLALHSLLKSYRGKVKLIYIDPPYNTGNDGFQYNDSFNHSSWLTFMRNRLSVAMELLREDGSIWISIDDDECHYVKIVCDNIFKRENFVSNVIWEKKYTVANDAKYFSDNHDHILVYAKNKEAWDINRLSRTAEMDKAYKNPDNHPKGVWKATPLQAKSGSDADFVHIFENGVSWRPPIGRYSAYSHETLDELYRNNEIWFGKDGQAVPSRKTFLCELKSAGVVPRTLWRFDEVGHNHEAKEEVKLLETTDGFDTPKPERLINRILQLGSNEGDIVLDYHLGSGTTAAVAHKMGRRYIGVEQMDYIETVAVERLKKVVGVKSADGMFDKVECDQGGISKAVSWQGGGSFVYCELAKANQQFAEEIIAATTKEQLHELWKAIEQTGFISYKVSPNIANEAAQCFDDLSIEDLQTFLLEILDKNLLYVPLSDIDDESYNISESDKKLNEMFYRKK